MINSPQKFYQAKLTNKKRLTKCDNTFVIEFFTLLDFGCTGNFLEESSWPIVETTSLLGIPHLIMTFSLTRCWGISSSLKNQTILVKTWIFANEITGLLEYVLRKSNWFLKYCPKLTNFGFTYSWVSDLLLPIIKATSVSPSCRQVTS